MEQSDIQQDSSEPVQLRFLLVSDLHMNVENLNLLKTWHIRKNKAKKYDYVFVSGDIANLKNHGDGTEEDTEACANEIKENMFTLLEAFGDKFYYIPGNHDPITMFNEDVSKRP